MNFLAEMYVTFFFYFFFFNDTATTEIYTLSLHDALPIYDRAAGPLPRHDHDAHAAVGLGHFHGDRTGPSGLSGLVRIRHHDDPGLPGGHQLLHAGGLFDGATLGVQRRQPALVPAPVLV